MSAYNNPVIYESRQNADSVTNQSLEMEEWLIASKLPRTLMLGTQGMREAGNEFLPQHPLESDWAYKNRLVRSTLLNAYRKTTSFLAGQVFQVEVIFADGVPQEFIDYADSVDVKKNVLDVFAKRNFMKGIGKGVSIIMVDAPVVDEAEVVTVADAEQAGLRPYFKDVPIESVLGALVDEEGHLIQLRILERKMVRVGQFGSKTVTQIRVLEAGTWTLYNVSDVDGSTTLDSSGTTPDGCIPIAIFIPGDETTIVTGETPIMDLAELNSKHWRSSSDQDNILHVARVPILFGKNVEVANMPVGVASMIVSNDDDASLEYVEVQGKAIESGREDLKETQAQMALYGLQALIPETVPKTATEKMLTNSESNSSLATWTIEYESCLQEAFEIMGQFIGIDFPKEGVILNKEFNLGIADPQELAQILAAHDAGILSAQACFSEFRRRGVFDEHLNWADMEADLEQEKREAIDMAQLAGSAFGSSSDDGEPGSEDDAEDDSDDEGDV